MANRQGLCQPFFRLARYTRGVKIASLRLPPPPCRLPAPSPGPRPEQLAVADQVCLTSSSEVVPKTALPPAFQILDPSQGSLQVADLAPLQARAERLRAQGTSLIAIRHGESQANASSQGPILSGRGDSPLTEQGRLQARQAATELVELYGSQWFSGERSPVVYTSPLSRAYDTATALQELLQEKGLTVSVQVDPDLQEIDFGGCEGQNAREVGQKFPNFARGVDFLNPFPAGESGLEVMKRVDRFLNRVASHPKQDVLFFGHTMTVGLTRTLLGGVDTDESGQLKLDPRSIPNARPVILVEAPARPVPLDLPQGVDGYLLS